MREEILKIMVENLNPFPIEGETYEFTQEDVIYIAGLFASKFKAKADKWDKLDAEISKFYKKPNYDYKDDWNYEDGGEGDLCDIGEIYANHLGYL